MFACVSVGANNFGYEITYDVLLKSGDKNLIWAAEILIGKIQKYALLWSFTWKQKIPEI